MRAEDERIASLRLYGHLPWMVTVRLRPLPARQLAQAMGARNQSGCAVGRAHVVKHPEHIGHHLPTGLNRLREVSMEPLATVSLRRLAPAQAEKDNITL
jgi:hypothetical protein